MAGQLSLSEHDWQPPTKEQLIALTRYIRDEQPEIWSIFQRIGFRDYMTIDEIAYVSRNVSKISHAFWDRDHSDGHQDALITLGLLARLADGMLSDDDLEGEWVAKFIEDRREVPSEIRNGHLQSGGWKPVELGWIMALAREVDADPKCWEYFVNLTDFQHDSPRDRPQPNPIDEKLYRFENKHCLFNRTSNLGIYPVLYGKRDGKIDDITEVEQVRKFLEPRHRTEPNITGGYNIEEYFEDLNR